MIIFKKTGLDIKTTKALRGRGMGRRYFPLQRTTRSGGAGAPAESENDFCALFLSEKPPLVNRILLNVAKCCALADLRGARAKGPCPPPRCQR